ncbi:ABC transporter permease [Gehongia tenuis]|uniref:ABC transporter permease n=1 Tax=Gehongia tenuis TaxID=2763655 RepID=A0A926D4T7_9FIRM|nr:ABC transporter permease [Gehongia tenuis]MBC8531266.1 ABC transporter permease [Gehongia tenuis]
MSLNPALEKKAYSKEHQAFLNGVLRRKRLISVARWGILIALLALWELAASLNWIDPFIISSPSRILGTLQSLWSEGTLLTHIGITLYETIVGFVLGTVLGLGLAIALWWSDTLSRILDPYLVVLNSLPKIALGPILIVWIGAGTSAIITMTLLISLIVTVMGMLNGFLEVSKEKVLLLKTFGATKYQILRKVILPASVPSLISSLKINIGMSWVGVIVGEYLVSKAGLGYLIVYGSQVFKLDLVMTSIVILSIAAALMYEGIALLERHVIKQGKL